MIAGKSIKNKYAVTDAFGGGEVTDFALDRTVRVERNGIHVGKL